MAFHPPVMVPPVRVMARLAQVMEHPAARDMVHPARAMAHPARAMVHPTRAMAYQAPVGMGHRHRQTMAHPAPTMAFRAMIFEHPTQSTASLGRMPALMLDIDLRASPLDPQTPCRVASVPHLLTIMGQASHLTDLRQPSHLTFRQAGIIMHPQHLMD